jgi:nucleoside-diphosphate-sugar epimerase
MQLLVTGHRGYIGAAIVPMLINAGHSIVGLDVDIFRGCNFDSSPMNVPEISKDLRDVESADIERFDAVIHLAALCNDPLGELNPEITYDINHRASIRLAKLAKEAGVRRFLFSSSCSTYGAAGDAPVDETASLNPITAYGRSKVLVEEDLARLADGRFSPTYLRNATAYGVSPRLRLDIVLNDFVATACTTGCIHIKSDGTPWRPIVHVEDIGRAFLAILDAPAEKVCDVAFNIGVNEDNYQVRELAEITREVVPGSRIEYAKDAGPDKRSYRVSFDRVGSVLPEFRAHWNARRGAQQLYEAFTGTGLTLDDSEGPRYRRVKQVRQLLEAGVLESDLRRVPTAQHKRLRFTTPSSNDQQHAPIVQA